MSNANEGKKIGICKRFRYCVNKIFMKRNGKPNKCSIVVSYIVFVVLVLLTLELQSCKRISGNIMGFVLQFPFCLLLLTGFIQICANKEQQRRGLLAFATILLFPLSTTLFIFNTSLLSTTLFQIISIFFLFVMLICLYLCVEMKENYDLSLLKAANYILIAFFTILVFFLKKNEVNTNNLSKYVEGQYVIQVMAHILIDYYYLIPLLIMQGLFELLENKKNTKLLISKRMEPNV